MEDDNKTEPLAKTRTRRSNAGARMHEMMFAAEVDPELFAQTYGGLLKAEDDSSDDEEYVPKDLEITGGAGEEADEAGEDASSGSSSASGTSDSDQDDEDDNEDDDVDDDDDEDDEDFDPNKPEESDDDVTSGDLKSEGLKSKNQTKDDDILRKRSAHIQPGSPTKAAYASCKICAVCLGDQSDEDDEIIECDSCGISVHESCYGASEEEQEEEVASTHSNISSESTEPWFCEPCRRSVKNPLCELCPNTGGIFKQTDTGRWIHMVCALYTRGVTFENIENLTDVSLFELNYALFDVKRLVSKC